jgi:hypothetical protein
MFTEKYFNVRFVLKKIRYLKKKKLNSKNQISAGVTKLDTQDEIGTFDGM